MPFWQPQSSPYDTIADEVWHLRHWLEQQHSSKVKAGEAATPNLAIRYEMLFCQKLCRFARSKGSDYSYCNQRDVWGISFFFAEFTHKIMAPVRSRSSLGHPRTTRL